MQTADTSKQAPFISTEGRVQSYENGTFACRWWDSVLYNLSLDHLRKGTINKHLDSATHKNKEIKHLVQAKQLPNKPVTITGLFKKSTESGDTRNVNTFELVEALVQRTYRYNG
ncbi:UNVERIFIED_CONTAM: hypothetical protein FKN15_057387 [Acipenser sinensis]